MELLRIHESERLLEVLEKFPGLTQCALTGLHKITPSTIYHCLDRKLIWVREFTVGHRSGSHKVFRFYPNRRRTER